MNFVGYKFFDEAKTRRSADVLKMEQGENLVQFQKRCKNLGYDCCDSRNLVDHMKFMSEELIMAELEKNRHPNLFLMCQNIINDFNIASCLRAANSFGVKEVILFNNNKYDRRGAVNAHNYLQFNYVKSLNEFYEIKNNFDIIVSLENCEGSQPINNYKWNYDKKTLIIVGQESVGVAGEFLEISDAILEIKMRGSTRSLNVAQAAAIALYDYNAKFDF